MNLADLLQEASQKKGLEIYSKLARVVNVYDDERTVDVEPLDGSADVWDVQLQPELSEKTGLIQIPKKGSLVIISWLSKSSAFVSLVLDPEKILVDCPEIIFNGGENKGLIIQSKLEAQIQNLNTNFTMLQNAIKSAPVTPSDGGAAFKTSLIAALNFQKADLSNVTNEKIKH